MILSRTFHKKYFRERGIVEKITRQGVAYGFPWRPPYKRDPHTRAGAGPGAEILWEAQEVNDSLEVVFPRLVAAGPGWGVPRVAPLAREALGADRPGADVEPCGKPAREPRVYKLARTRTTNTHVRDCVRGLPICKCVHVEGSSVYLFLSSPFF